jgi:hypothetical protein
LCAVTFRGGLDGRRTCGRAVSTASQALVAGSPTAIACGGFVDARVTVTSQSGSSGQTTNVMLVLDLSGSTGVPPSKLADLKRAAKDSLDALDAADGATDQSIAGNAAGVVVYRGSTAASGAAGSSYVVNAPALGSPHDAGINTTPRRSRPAPPGSPRWC